MKRTAIRWPAILAIAAAAGLLAWAGASRLSIDTDITASLPTGDPVIADANYVMNHHPVRDRVAIDCGMAEPDPDALVDAAAILEARLAASGLFESVGMDEYREAMPALVTHVTGNLPVLLTAEDLETRVRPLIAPGAVRRALAENYARLVDIGGIGQSGMMAADPLELRNIVLARMSHLAPTNRVQFVRGRLVSADGRHLLVAAEPRGSSTDTVLARKIAAAISAAEADLAKAAGRGTVTVTPVGAYRAALDNEDTAKGDTKIAILVATIGIAILLLVGFPRPLVGILALFPALMGTICATFVYSLFSREISILAVGFGSTIISFTVDYGIAYLLFLDRTRETGGFEASREVWGIGLLAMLTTAISFAFLFVTGFSALREIGIFAALGVAFTYLFVHTVLPLVFPAMPPARREGFIPLRRLVDRLMDTAPWWKAAAAIAFGAVMLFFARPDFRVDLASMNSVSRGTLDAERLITSVWGDVLSRIYLMTEAESLDRLREKGDRLGELLAHEVSAGGLSSAFVPTALFPGREAARRNGEAWARFWTPARVAALKRAVRDSSRDIGFAPGAFREFLAAVERRSNRPPDIPESLHGILNIRRMPGGGWAQFSVLTPGRSYRPGRLHGAIASAKLGRLFDPGLFADRLGAILLNGFITMALIVGGITVLVAILFLLDLRLTLTAMAPTLFSLVCTSGTLNLLGIRPGIPAVIVMVIVIGMGTDYALYLVRAYQRYRDGGHPSLGLIRMTVFLSAMSTLTGFGVLALAQHTLLRNAGLALLMGIGYSFLGTVMIVPPLAGRILARREVPAGPVEAGSREHAARVRRRYRGMEPYPRLFASFKLRFDPMFAELHRFVGSPRVIMDIGTGYGVPAAWLLELFPGATVIGIEPDERRRTAAVQALGKRGRVDAGRAPDVPAFEGKADAALAIDMIHYLDDASLSLMAARVRSCLAPDGVFIIRATIPMRERATVLRLIELVWIKTRGLAHHYRSEAQIAAMLGDAGFSVEVAVPSGEGREEYWFTARPRAAAKKAGKKRT